MFYYEVLVGDMQYHGKSALTYSSEQEVVPGSVVRIALRSRSVLGIVQRAVPEPAFRAKPLSAIAPTPALPPQTLQLIEWLYAYYPAPFGAVIRQFLPPSTAFPKKTSEKNESADTPPAGSTPKQPPKTAPPLTSEQSNALKHIPPTGYSLLHGVTGSGKTRLYIELTRRALESGRSAIILTPEIGLTTQLAEAFVAAFEENVFVIHSRQTSAERRDVWYAVSRSAKPVIVVGPRSALFAPVRTLGLIVLDESHDQAYKSEAAPHYRTERVAARLAQLHSACCVSGSATPNIEEYYLAHAKKRPILPLRSLAVQNEAQTKTTVVDLRDRSALSKSPILSTPLIDAVKAALHAQEQSMLFLNRRGTAGAILCSACGWQAVCTHCDLALTYHSDAHAIRCHVCGRSWPLPGGCPECSETDIVLKTVGTKAVVDEVRRLFPHARIGRFDADTAKSEQLETQLKQLQEGAIDIIVGTQMITKGLDLPKLSVVGVLNADASLLIPDYTASERTFQLLTQVVGRTARGHRAGTVVVQTYNPHHPTITAALTKNWSAFYENELAERHAFRFPPFVYMVKLTCLRASSASAEKTALKLRQQIEKDYPRLKTEGPAAAFHPRESGKYKWQLIVKATTRTALTELVGSLPSGWQYDIDPVNLL